uniref:Uncharacterized protein n=1 Tax=Astyanax mexicanus TaxID=7994 RepID=A0A8B9H669_ASTMX
VLRLGQVSGKLGTSDPYFSCRFGLARLQVACTGLAHVVAPLGFVELHLLLSIREHSQVGQGPLFAQVGGYRDPTFCAARAVDLQLAPCHALWYPGFASFGSHACAFALRFGCTLECLLLALVFRPPHPLFCLLHCPQDSPATGEHLEQLQPAG